MNTLGPFYPASVAQRDYQPGDNAFQNPENAAGPPGGGDASVSVSGEGVTKYLVARDFRDAAGNPISLPANAVVRRVSMDFHPDVVNQGFNVSDALLQHPTLGALDATGSSTGAKRAFDDGEDGETFNNAAWGFDVALYVSGGGTVNVSDLALAVEVD